MVAITVLFMICAMDETLIKTVVGILNLSHHSGRDGKEN
jgi:hypothetical protein